MKRFFCPTLADNSVEVSITDPQEVRHISVVLRVRNGSVQEFINGQGVLAQAEIISQTRNSVTAKVLGITIERPPFAQIVLACAMPKKSKFDDIIEKATELGAQVIIPLITDRTSIVQSAETLARLNERFRNISISAAKQSRRLWFPKITPVTKFHTAIDLMRSDHNLILFPWLEGDRVEIDSLRDRILHLNQESADERPSAVVVFIGPEGDFSEREAEYAMANGGVPVSLGPTVLRVETAALAVLSYARFLLAGK